MNQQAERHASCRSAFLFMDAGIGVTNRWCCLIRRLPVPCLVVGVFAVASSSGHHPTRPMLRVGWKRFLRFLRLPASRRPSCLVGVCDAASFEEHPGHRSRSFHRSCDRRFPESPGVLHFWIGSCDLPAVRNVTFAGPGCASCRRCVPGSRVRSFHGRDPARRAWWGRCPDYYAVRKEALH